MNEIIQKIISVLTNDSALTAIVPATNIFVGPVDIVEETQNGLYLPQINIHVITEVSRTVPLNTRDTTLQLDIWSRNSQLEVVQVYELIITALNYSSADQSTAHIYWERLSGTSDDYESDRRIFHRSMTVVVWSQKP
jgi:hypothetical protein